MQIHELTALARNSKASDIHISEGLPLMFRIDGHLAEAPVQLSAAVAAVSDPLTGNSPSSPAYKFFISARGTPTE